MSPVADWGTTLIETDLDRLVLRQLRLWLPTYLAQAERERGLPNRLLARPRPESYQNTLSDEDVFPDARLPAVVVTTARTEGEPDVHPNRIGASWLVQVTAVVRGRTAPETREIAAVFGGCVRRLLLEQQIDLEAHVWWRGSAVIDDIEDQTDAGRYLAAGTNAFVIYADEVITGEGPVLSTPDDPYPPPDPEGAPDEPYDPLATVRNVTTTIIARS